MLSKQIKSLIERLGNDKELRVEVKELKALWKKAVELELREAAHIAILEHNRNELELNEIAEVLGCSRESVRYIEASALKNLKHPRVTRKLESHLLDVSYPERGECGHASDIELWWKPWKENVHKKPVLGWDD